MVNWQMRQLLKRYLSGLGAGGSLWTGDSDDMVALHGPDGRFRRVSDSALQVTGHAADDLAGKSLAEITAADDRGAALRALADACWLGRKGRAEFRICRADGTTGWAEMTVAVNKQGQIRTIIRDVAMRHARDAAEIAARKKAEAEAEARSSYLADLSHEIRTPLNAVIGFADMMRNETFGPIGHEKYEEYAGLIHKSGEHLLDLISDLLDMSKIEAGKYVLSPAATDMTALIEDCVEMMRLEAEKAGLTMALDLETEAGELVEADPKALRQMLLNLLSNAVKFTEKGSVTVRLRRDSSNIWLSVIDTGIGMSRDQLDRIGNRFEQAHREGVRGARGTGLGLALSHALAGLHEGELRVASREGEGTSAVIRLPYRPVAVVPQENVAPRRQATGNALFESLGQEIEERLNARQSA